MKQYDPEPLDDDVPNPRIFTRLYMTNGGGSYDIDGDITAELVKAIENRIPLLKFDIPSCGETYYIRLNLIEGFSLKSIDSMRRIWENELRWKAYHKSVMGYREGD